MPQETPQPTPSQRESIHPDHPDLPPLPAKEEMALLEPFERIGMDRILVVATPHACAQALAQLQGVDVLGFDTESKPTFLKGEVSGGPHVVQFAVANCAWVFQLHDPVCRAAVADLLASTQVTKVGFGLDGDRTQILAKFGVAPNAVLDLDNVLRKMGYRKSVGVKTAIALLFNQRLLKSKKVATTNWANLKLSEMQVMYAANDAWAAYRVYQALGVVVD
jgi:ribonuclease D